MTANELEIILLKAGGAVLGLIIFYLVFKLIRGKRP
jgi:hypothetical protein